MLINGIQFADRRVVPPLIPFVRVGVIFVFRTPRYLIYLRLRYANTYMNIEVRDIRTKYFIAAIQWSMICFRYSEEYLRIMSPITSGDCARDYFTHDEQSYIRGD